MKQIRQRKEQMGRRSYMATVSETELKQKASEFIMYVREYMVNANKDIKLKDTREGFVLTIIDKDAVLDFSL